MSTYQLKPRRRIEPKCADFADEALVIDYERAMRGHRALGEGFAIEPLTRGRRDGTYRVASPSGGVYLVDVVDSSGAHDSCTCADFATGRLGTCKHLEAVRRAFTEVQALRRLPLPDAPDRITATIDPRGELPRLSIVGPRSAALARRLAQTALPDAASARQWLASLDLRVTHAVIPVLEQLMEREARTRRRESLARTITDRRFELDLLSRPLFPYQIEGVAHLVIGGRALLADDMGLGKTVQAIAACEALARLGETQRVLVVTPASLKAQWAREIEIYAGRHAVVIGGGARRRRELLSSGAPYLILNYELLWRDLELAREIAADIIILDEAQRAKNFRTRTAGLLRALPSRFLFVLTGTPVENRLDDLYSLMQLIDPAVLGPLWRFNLDFHEQTSRNRRSGYRNLSALRASIGPYVLRRRKEEVLSQLPPLVSQTRYVALTPLQAKLEKRLRTDAAQLLAVAQRRSLSPAEQRTLSACCSRRASRATPPCWRSPRSPARPRTAAPSSTSWSN